jgi:TonB-linked SusC/RagA family outer membrane protein
MIKKIYYLIILSGSLLFGPDYARAQDVISGVVKDESGQTLPGATVVEKGSAKYALTDVDGKFSIAAAKEFPFTLQVSITGFQQQEIEIYELTTEAVEIILKTANVLDEVVVIGYGEQKRKDITGSVASVPIEIKSQPVASVERLLQGSVAGAVVTQTSGQPGGGVSVQIRGNNSITAGSDPLYVIDGFPINNDYSVADAGVTDGSKINPLSSINTADIENIDVLKDASATAIYGSRGANGVVIITTKSGTKNKSSVNYDAYYGTQQVLRTIPLLNAAQWWQLRKDAAANSGKTASIPATGYSLDTTGAGTDWQDAAFRKASIQSHNLSILSGSDKTKLAFSGNYFKQNGILQNTDFRRLSARVNLDHQYNDRFRIFTSLNRRAIPRLMWPLRPL